MFKSPQRTDATRGLLHHRPYGPMLHEGCCVIGLTDRCDTRAAYRERLRQMKKINSMLPLTP